jgi:uncharacterized protein YrrD
MSDELMQNPSLTSIADALPGLQEPVEGLLEDWREMALKASGRHSAAYDRYENLDSFYGVGSTVLTALVGSTIFVTLQKTASEAIRIIAGLVAAVAAIASGVQTAAKYGQRAERYRQASRHYATVSASSSNARLRRGPCADLLAGSIGRTDPEDLISRTVGGYSRRGVADCRGRIDRLGGATWRLCSAASTGRWRDRDAEEEAVSVLVTGSAIRGLPVVTIAGGEDVAEVRDVIYSPEAGRVVGLTLNKRGFLAGRRREVLSAETIRAIGRDAVMIDDESSLIMAESSPADLGTPPSGRDVTGDEVLTEGGASLGQVRDIVVLVGSNGAVVGYEIDTTTGGIGYIPVPSQLAVSGSALVVPDTTRQFIEDDLAGLGAAVDESRSKLGLP